MYLHYTMHLTPFTPTLAYLYLTQIMRLSVYEHCIQITEPMNSFCFVTILRLLRTQVAYDHLFIMTPDTAQQPALCFASCLSMRPTNSPSWRPEAREALLSLGQKHRMNFEVVVNNRIGTVHWLKVFSSDTRRPMEESLLHLGSKESNYYLNLYRTPHGLGLEEGQNEAACVTHVLDWNTFYVQLTKHSGELDWLTER